MTPTNIVDKVMDLVLCTLSDYAIDLILETFLSLSDQ